MADLVEYLTAHPSRTGLFLDFDGTLAPIVTDPATSKLAPGLGPLVARLRSRLGLVALVSGRPARMLAERAAATGARLFGLYGLEEWVDGHVLVREEAARWQGAVEIARERLAEAVVPLTGVMLEDKGLSVAVHWRNAVDRERAGAAVAELVAQAAHDTGLWREPGKLVEELRPPVEWDKGSAVRALASELGLSALVFVGDDVADLTAFAAVHELGGFVIAVDHGEESPPEVLADADLVLEGIDGVAAWLGDLEAALAER